MFFEKIDRNLFIIQMNQKIKDGSHPYYSISPIRLSSIL